MFIIYCFIAFLSLGLHNASRNVAEQDGDIPFIYSDSNLIKVNLWFLLVGLIIPFITMFFYVLWYWGILINLVMLLGSMIIANYFTYNLHTVKRPPFNIPSRVDVRPSIIVSIISVILFIIMVL